MTDCQVPCKKLGNDKAHARATDTRYRFANPYANAAANDCVDFHSDLYSASFSS